MYQNNTKNPSGSEAKFYTDSAIDILSHARGCGDRQATSNAVKTIDLVNLIQNHGVTLKKSGTRYVGLCPFHDEKTPSFFVYPNNRFYCFGCHAKGDAADFLMQLYGCSFPEALERLGIKEAGRPLSRTHSKQIEKAKEKRALIASFRRWEASYSTRIGKLIVAAYQCLSRIKTEEDMDKIAWVYKPLTAWEYHLDVLCYGTDRDKYLLFQEVANG